MLFSNRSKCNIESLFKITCSASSQIIGPLKTKPFMPLVKGGFSVFLYLICSFEQRWRISSQFMSFTMVKANITTVCLNKQPWNH